MTVKTLGMFSYILSLFKSAEQELSTEDVEAILTEDVTNENPPEKVCLQSESAHTKLFKEEYNFSKKVGKITGIKDDKYIIDDVYEYASEQHHFDIGASITYQLLVSEGKFIVYNVNLIINDWDTAVPKESIVTSRVMVCQVEKRDRRILFLTPGDIKVNLDDVATQFIPHVGDWLELDVKYEVNENALDLSGDVIEVNQISPLRPHIESGKISHWDAMEHTGSINRKVFFTKDAISCGYMPVVGDQVVAEIIESQQGKLSWRALKVLPELIGRQLQGPLKSEQEAIEIHHSSLDISECSLSFDKLGQSHEVNITLTNKSDNKFHLLNVELPNTVSQIYFSDTIKSGEIPPKGTFVLNLSCTAKNMGVTNELLLFHFEGFTLGKYVNITVNSNKTGGYYQRNSHRNSYYNSYSSEKEVIRGQKSHGSRFAGVKIPDYTVPKKLQEVVMKYDEAREKISLTEELRQVKPTLFSNLNPLNYEEKFHTLLHLEEITNLVSIRQYDQDRACFIPNKEFLMLEIENLSERRPSIVLGDKILAGDPSNVSHQEYEGNVFKVGAKHVYLKFSSLFHDMYRGEDYSIRVVPGRSSYKRQHHGIALVARNLGNDWLFPIKIVEKDPQLTFVYDFYPRIDQSTSPNGSSNKRLSASELLAKARKVKEDQKKLADNCLLNQDGEKVENDSFQKQLKLEWYNKQLNCKQKDAVINVIKGVSRPLPYIIFGPPGTGKTVTVIECILQIMRLIPDCRILVTAPSNSAADLIALRLIGFGVLRPGDLVRLVSVNYALGDNIPAQLVSYCATASMAKGGTAEENILGHNGVTLDCSRAVLGRHKITVSTCSSSGALHLTGFPRGHFTHIFVDEAGQASEPEVMIPTAFLDKNAGQVVMAGDPMQLGPVILSSVAKECGLEESYLERMINRFPYVRDLQGFPDTEGFDPRLVTKLLHNYRSLDTILHLFSSLFYHGDLIPTISLVNSPESRLLDSLESVLPKTKDGRVPAIVFHGVEGENYQSSDSPSWYNPHEAAQIFFYINEFLRLGIKSENIGIITPYTKQVHEIKQLLREAEFPVPRTGTVEDFQGQEFDVILMSTVRSSRDYVPCDVLHNLGFVSSRRRLNVAISRAKSLLVIVGNPALLCYDPYWQNVISYVVEYGAYTGCDL